MANIVKARLMLRTGTQQQWESNNPILLRGQPGYSTTDNILKIGDGVTPWNELDISGSGGGGTIPSIATLGTVGGVRSSNAADKIKVGSDGTMIVNSVNTNLLYVKQGDELILDGGGS